ncbi:hypothetical protein C5167_039751 [Papaver somniferum]|uniref:Transcription factor CBF/NF-Y/archaeal histone domain-containing protein n=2 Tax=Papaver somniferum TaxID=3469 RepID=A0A4Y7ID73_PAPSO|nr:dr1-associated corepressor-like isoform X1 [Papaver somniferum]RZC46804.1 hypothetical protein C5167_039751 [Papaver somniferum]
MRKKLDTRFPASRIKKIMQADEDVGKIALAVPLLVSKALELFLQDLCDRTYDVTLRRGAKTMSSLHLKQCVQSFNVFDFLKEILSKVPDFGGSDAGGEDRANKRSRKTVVDEDNDSEEEGKRNRISHETGHNSSSGRGRGRSRGRGRGRGRPLVDRESIRLEKCEGDPDMSPQHDNQNPETISPDNGIEPRESADNMTTFGNTSDTEIRNFDLNVVLDDSGTNQLVRSDSGTTAAPSATAASTSGPATSAEPPPEIKQHEEYPGWSISDMDKMSIDPLQLAQLNSKRLDEEEDYDEEEE